MTAYATQRQDLPMAHWIGLGIYLALIALMALTTFWPDPPEDASGTLRFSLRVLPLLIFVPGLLRARNMTYIWASCVVMVYFMELSVTAYLRDWPWSSTLPMILTVLFFIVAMVKIRKDPRNPRLGSQR